MGTDLRQQFALLSMVHSISEKAVQGFRIADDPVDEQLLEDLERIVERTRKELESLPARMAEASSSSS